MPAQPTVLAPLRFAAGIRAWLQSPWQTMAMLGGLGYWLIGGIVFSLVCWLLLWLLPRRIGRRVGRSMLRGGFRLFVRYLRVTRLAEANLTSLAPLRAMPGPLLLAPNHLSLWDAVFLLSCLPRAVTVMKPSILRNPLLGGGASLAGHIPAENHSGMIRAAAAALAEGGQVVLFPEGTRTRPESRWLNPLKGGIALVARRAGVPVHPVFIRSNSHFMEKGWPPWKRPQFPIHMEFELGAPIAPAPSETPQQFIGRLEQVFHRELSRPHPLRRQTND